MTELHGWAYRNLLRIERDYDGDHDLHQCEGAPRVTWAEWYLMEALKQAIGEVQDLQKRIAALEAKQPITDDEY